ncbi:MAG: type II secretion system protein GspG [Planctomycetota bacterium]|jgi:general secretion pathway protein G
MSTSTDREQRRGFTLVEIMVVVVIIGLLSALVGPEIFRMLGFGQASIAETKCKSLHDQAMIWKMINRKPPDSLDEMVAPLKQGDDANFLESVPEDPWGNPYILEREGSKIRIYSWGDDGQEGTEDDIVYPKGER